MTALIILIPVLSYGTLITQQAIAFFEWLRPQLEPETHRALLARDLPARFPLLGTWIAGQRRDGDAHRQQRAAQAWRRRPTTPPVALAGLATAVLDATLFLMMLFFLLRDGDDLREGFRGVSPLTRGQETEAMRPPHPHGEGRPASPWSWCRSLQGVVAFFGFWMLGVPSPLLWSVMVVFAALIPLVGSPLAWVPAALYLFLAGSPGRAACCWRSTAPSSSA